MVGVVVVVGVVAVCCWWWLCVVGGGCLLLVVVVYCRWLCIVVVVCCGCVLLLCVVVVVVCCCCGGCGADLGITCVSLVIRTHACTELNGLAASALAPSAGLTSRQKSYACSLRRQVPGVPRCKTHPTPSRGKRLRGSPTSPPLRRKGSAIFSMSSALDAPDPEKCEDTPGRVFLVSRTLLPKLPPGSE